MRVGPSRVRHGGRPGARTGRTDKGSGIVNEANDWAIETMDNPKHPLELVQRVVTVSLETQKSVNAPSPLDSHPLDLDGGE